MQNNWLTISEDEAKQAGLNVAGDMHIHVFLGPEGYKASEQKIKDEILRSMKQIEEDYADTIAIPRKIVNRVGNALTQLEKLGQTDLSNKKWYYELRDNPEMVELKHRVFRLAENALMEFSNFIDKDKG